MIQPYRCEANIWVGGNKTCIGEHQSALYVRTCQVAAASPDRQMQLADGQREMPRSPQSRRQPVPRLQLPQLRNTWRAAEEPRGYHSRLRWKHVVRRRAVEGEKGRPAGNPLPCSSHERAGLWVISLVLSGLGGCSTGQGFYHSVMSLPRSHQHDGSRAGLCTCVPRRVFSPFLVGLTPCRRKVCEATQVYGEA